MGSRQPRYSISNYVQVCNNYTRHKCDDEYELVGWYENLKECDGCMGRIRRSGQRTRRDDWSFMGAMGLHAK